MVERVDGPFRYYPDLHAGVTGDSIRADSHGPGLSAQDISALADDLEGDAKRVPQQISGAVAHDVEVNPQTASASARDLAAKGHYAVGLMDSFAGMVDLFDITVNLINHRYNSDLAMAMRWEGQAAAATPDKADDAKVDEAHIGPQIKVDLKPQYAAAVTALDHNADAIATKFRQGPTVENVRTLIRAGLIPLHAAALYPGLTLTDTDRAAYFRSLAYLPQVADQDQPDLPDEDAPPLEVHWWDRAWDGVQDGGAWLYNHTVVPGVNGLADVGQAMVEHPEDTLSMLGGAGLMLLGAGGEVGGGALDITGVGAVAGVPINVASAAVIASGGALATAGGADLIHNAAQNSNVVLNEAGGAGARPGDPLPGSARPGSAGSNWEGRVANTGKGQVWQDPAKVDAPPGTPKNANSVRLMDPTPEYPHGYVRYYNEHGQPMKIDGKPGSDKSAATHFPMNPDGTYPVPEGWSP